MKKIIFLLSILLLISGCSAKQAGRIAPVPNNGSDMDNIQSDNTTNNMDKNKGIEMENSASLYSQAIMKTNLGDIKIKFYAAESPLTVNNFLNLAKNKFYD